MRGVSAGWFVSSFSCQGAASSLHPELLSFFCGFSGEGDILGDTQQGGHCTQYPFCACTVLLHKGEELPFPYCGRVVETFELNAQKEENVTCLFVSFLEVDEAGMDKGQMQTTSRCPHFPPTELPVAGWRACLKR